MAPIALLLALVLSSMMGQTTASRKGIQARPRAAGSTVLHVALGDSSTRKWLRTGWNQNESAGRETWVWSQGPSSVIELPLPTGRDLLMVLDCQPFTFTGSPRQTVAIVLNGMSIATVALRPGRQTYSVALPGAALRPSNTIEFHYAYARRPQEVDRQSGDTRSLAVLWRSIDLTTAPKP